MEIRQLRYFITVAQTLNFSEAARRLYITQGTLSQQIRQLEFELGSQLFERSSHSVSLTEAGEELLPLALETTAASEACLTRMNDIRGALAGTLRIGCIRTFRGMTGDAVRTFLRENEGVSLNIQFATVEELMEMLRNKEIDLALAYKSLADDDGIESEQLFRTSLHILMSKDHPLAGEKSLTLDRLCGYGMIIPGRGAQARRSFDRFIGIDTRRLNVKLETNDPDLAMSLVQSGSLLAISTPLPALDCKMIKSVTLENSRYEMSCCVHRLRGSYRKKSAELFIQLLRDYARIEKFAIEEHCLSSD